MTFESEELIIVAIYIWSAPASYDQLWLKESEGTEMCIYTEPVFIEVLKNSTILKLLCVYFKQLRIQCYILFAYVPLKPRKFEKKNKQFGWEVTVYDYII